MDALIVSAVVAPLLPATRADSDVTVLSLRVRAGGDGGGTRAA